MGLNTTNDNPKKVDEFNKGFRDALKNNPCCPNTMEYVAGYERGLETKKIGTTPSHGGRRNQEP